MNHRNTFRWVMLCTVLVGHAALAQAPRVAVVDMEALMRAHPNTAADKRQLQETLQTYEAQGERLREHLHVLKDAYEKAAADAGNPALSPRARTEAEETARTARQTWQSAEADWREQMQNLQQRLNEQELRLLRRTIADLRVTVRQEAEARDVELVLDVSGARGGLSGVVHAAEHLDLTDAVRARMGVPAGAGDAAQEEGGEPDEDDAGIAP